MLWSILMFVSSKVVKMESCRRRYHSVSNHSIKPRRALCLQSVGGGGRPRPTSGVTLSANEWTMAIHQSSMPACLAAWNQLQCPSQSNLIPSVDSFISLTSFAIQTDFLKRGELDSKERMAAKYWIQGNQQPVVQNIAWSTVGERWSLSQYHGGSFI